VRDDPFYFHSLGAWEKLRVCAAQLAALVLVPITDLQKRGALTRANPSRIVDIESSNRGPRPPTTLPLFRLRARRGPQGGGREAPLQQQSRRRLLLLLLRVARTTELSVEKSRRQRRLSKARAWPHSLLFM